MKTSLLALVLGICAMGTLSGCSGGVHGNHVTEDIAPVVVTATNGTATHSVTVTAVVNF
jgi:TctA family transporter